MLLLQINNYLNFEDSLELFFIFITFCNKYNIFYNYNDYKIEKFPIISTNYNNNEL